MTDVTKDHEPIFDLCTKGNRMKNNNNKPTFVDVRTLEEFSQDHIDSAINIPVHEIQYRIHEFKRLPKPIILYCRSGNRSGMAVSVLKQNGIDEAINGGGLEDLKKRI